MLIAIALFKFIVYVVAVRLVVVFGFASDTPLRDMSVKFPMPFPFTFNKAATPRITKASKKTSTTPLNGFASQFPMANRNAPFQNICAENVFTLVISITLHNMTTFDVLKSVLFSFATYGNT